METGIVSLYERPDPSGKNVTPAAFSTGGVKGVNKPESVTTISAVSPKQIVSFGRITAFLKFGAPET